MKKVAATNSILDDLPRRIFDQSAMTTREIAAQTTMSQDTAARFASKQVEAGLWEQVWKRVKPNAAPVPAYRRVGRSQRFMV